MPHKSGAAPFAGFALPTSNTTYTPNQFFDVCLPNASRGCVRLVALLIRRTLGWSDAEGRPLAERFALRYADFESAGISRSMIKAAVAEALKARYIRCSLPPRSKSRGQPAVTATFELNWDEGRQYIKDPRQFRGFFAGDGNRTYIPNQLFDHVVAAEPLAVVKAVGAVARFSIGFANKWGHRRTLARLSFTDIQRYTHISDRKTVSGAIEAALAGNYLQRVEEGYFDRNGGRNSRTATYALKWLQLAPHAAIGSKTPPAKTERKDRFENPTGIGMKTPPADRYENPTGIQITSKNNNSKQQAVAVSSSKQSEITAAGEILRGAGFDSTTARRLGERYGIERIIRQVEWIDRRSVKRNRLGMLRLAIEQDWGKPEPIGKFGRPNSSPQDDELARSREKLANHFRSPY